MPLINEDVAKGIWLLDSTPYQKGEYQYQVIDDQVLIREIGSQATIIRGKFDEFDDIGTSSPYLNINDLVTDLNNYLFQ